LLDDGPFHIVTQLGLVDSDDCGILMEQLQKHYAPKGDDLEWKYRLQNRHQMKALCWLDYPERCEETEAFKVNRP